MKRIIAIFLTAVAAFSISGGAFAQEDQTGQNMNQGTAILNEEAVPQGEPTGLTFDPDKNQDNAVLDQTVLRPGVEYQFPANLIFNGKAYPITEKMVKNMRFSYNKLTNTAVKTFKIQESKGKYFLFVEMKDSVPNEVGEIRYTIKLTPRDGSLALFSQEVGFQYGYHEYDNDIIADLEKGEEVYITNNSPVITDVQFERIAEINEYRKAVLAGPSWKVEVSVTAENTKNFLSNHTGIREILTRFPNQEFKFFNFPGKPSFASAGKVGLNVETLLEDYQDLYVYRYANGRLYTIKGVLNEETKMMEFHTNRLDNFFVTNRKLPDGYQIA